MSRLERYLWNGVLLATPWLSYFAIAGRFGEAAADRLYWLFVFMLVTALVLAASNWFAWLMAREVRRALTTLRLQTNRAWKWTHAIEPEQVTVGATRIWVGKGVSGSQREQLARVSEALAIVGEILPSRLGRMRRLGTQLAVAHSPAYAAYIPGANALVIDPHALAESPAVLASIIVHELNHALTSTRGMVHPWQFRRMERLACLDQYDFARRLYHRGRPADALRIRDLVAGSMRADMSFRTRWKRIRESVDRHSRTA